MLHLRLACAPTSFPSRIDTTSSSSNWQLALLLALWILCYYALSRVLRAYDFISFQKWSGGDRGSLESLGITAAALGRLLTSYSEESDQVHVDVTTTIRFIPDHLEPRDSNDGRDSGPVAFHPETLEQVISINDDRSPVHACDFAYRHDSETRTEFNEEEITAGQTTTPVGHTTPVGVTSSTGKLLADALNLAFRPPSAQSNNTSPSESRPSNESSLYSGSAQANTSSSETGGLPRSTGMEALLRRIGPPVSGNSTSFDTEESDTEVDGKEGETEVTRYRVRPYRGCRGSGAQKREERRQQREAAELRDDA
ncbi:hypothetical protein QFC21_006578 [Naganishia friedmannii]|uniref:Uncharacterized protein n=1 Tax=Naganishia friedmannii TaxID=89922 RepID=A0ACC2V1G3_9TREE|nr:hypothetical protein QFC21_006578 [Naganishia friedmannii]